MADIPTPQEYVHAARRMHDTDTVLRMIERTERSVFHGQQALVYCTCGFFTLNGDEPAPTVVEKHIQDRARVMFLRLEPPPSRAAQCAICAKVVGTPGAIRGVERSVKGSPVILCVDDDNAMQATLGDHLRTDASGQRITSYIEKMKAMRGELGLAVL